MSRLGPDDFKAFFIEVYGKDKDGKPIEPFPWQERLVRRVCGSTDSSNKDGPWPRCIALPTAAGKTACIDIAVFALACQASFPPEIRTAPRRIFFVVDRRVVVDQAYDHAEKLSDKLANAKDGILGRVAAALKKVGGCECESDCKCRPLDYYALRGGMYRESAWVRSPLQPTVVTSTVDQVGSRLLFRGYGVSPASMPLHAALVGNDALILLDEAHCARPFDQTMSLVRKYRDWTESEVDRLPLPFHFVAMSATPPKDVLEDEDRRKQEKAQSPSLIFEPDEQDRNPKGLLGKRIAASKLARLVIAAKAKGAKWRDELVKELVEQAKRLQAGDARAVGVIVNRVATAREVAKALLEPPREALEEADKESDAEARKAKRARAISDTPDVILLTGRMRPVDRDAIMAKIKPLLSKNSHYVCSEMKPTFVVATQTLEVGADLDFHALVTECASLDALRQRFGRLNRVAARDKAEAVIVVRADQTEPAGDETKADPVYGNALANTWQWLLKHAKDMPADEPATADGSTGEESKAKGKRGKKGSASSASVPTAAEKIIDFGVAAMEERSKAMTPEQLAALNAPAPDAAILLPAHLDMWCQTSPRPVPDPDPSYFLHGPRRQNPEVQVVFRADLGDDPEKWAEIASFCPPSSSEALSVRLGDFRRWLTGKSLDERSSDVEGEQIAEEPGNGEDDAATATRHAVRWRGPDSRETVVIDAPRAVTPSDTYVVSIADDDQQKAAALLGDFPVGDDGAPRITDAGDQAYQRSRDKAILRLRHGIYPALDASFDTLDPEAMEDDEVSAKVNEALAALKKQLVTNPDESLRRAVDALGAKRHRTIARHPLGGIVLIGKRRLHQFDPTFVEPEDSWESASDRLYPLDQHCRDVANRTKAHAEQSGLGSHSSVLGLAGRLHDAGKADPRFQAWLHGGNSRRAEMCGTQYAKSIVPVRSRRELIDFRNRAGYPAGARHELASVRLAECDGASPADLNAAQRDLALHLIAAHHGYCRPFAPVVEDLDPREIAFQYNDRTLNASSATGLERLDSGVAERFWTLTRRFGWWGLAHLEALLRLADWACSEPAESAAPVATGNSSSSTCVARSRRAPSEVAT